MEKWVTIENWASLEKCTTLGRNRSQFRKNGSHLEKSASPGKIAIFGKNFNTWKNVLLLEEMFHTWKNVPHLEKSATLVEKLVYTRKNVPQSEKCAALEKM